MPTENNDYMNWFLAHEDTHSRNLKMNKETAIKDYQNSIKPRVDSYPMVEFQKPLVDAFNLNLRWYTLEELKKYKYDTRIDDWNYYVRAA